MINDLRSFLLVILFLTPLQLLHAHNVDQSYIFLRVEEGSIGGRVEITTKDLNRALNLGLVDGMTPESLQPHMPAIHNYISTNVFFDSEFGDHKMIFSNIDIMPSSFGDFVLVKFSLSNTSKFPEAVNVRYSILMDPETDHRGLLVMEYNPKVGITNNEALPSLLFSPGNPYQTVSLSDTLFTEALTTMVKLGVWHIWIGLDHILFLLALILPAVATYRWDSNQRSSGVKQFFQRSLNAREPVEQFKPAFIYVLKIVTFFTLAHTITLSLAALEIMTLPSALVETIIAISIGMAAYHNIQPIFRGPDWLIAFVFGLFHGFGFASVLEETGLGGDFVTLSLFGFNLGVEIGQVAIICGMFPILFVLRKKKVYPKILVFGSIGLILIAVQWTVERSFGVEIPILGFLKSIFQ